MIKSEGMQGKPVEGTRGANTVVPLMNIRKEIYENITQCLCLARLQLGNIDMNNKEQSAEVISEACLLIGKAVKDLRNLARQLTPDF